MPDSSLTNSKIVAAYREKTPGSAARAEQAREIFPSGITHDSRKTDPYGIYVARAEGSRKWDVDGNEYVDYFGGHGALILGHNHPTVMAAVHGQLDLGTHFGASHELEVEWGDLIQQLVPSAEKVRFTASGTEANLMAFRLARAFTGKTQIVRFLSHFHGWQDHVSFANRADYEGGVPPGVLDGIVEGMVVVRPDAIESVQEALDGRDDIAAVILEPTGASFGQLPLDREFVAELRRITERQGIILIFDEVVTGFRISPGGAQAHYGITPDLTSLAKILSGGLPGGAVAGRRDILDLLDFEVAEKKGFTKIAHQGTFNANPVSAAAGVAALTEIASGEVCDRASRQTANIRAAVNDVLADEGVPWACYGDHSAFYFFTNPEGLEIDPKKFDGYAQDFETMRKAGGHPTVAKFRLAMLTNGVDITGKPGGTVSAAHTDEDVALTAEAVRASIGMLREEGDL